MRWLRRLLMRLLGHSSRRSVRLYMDDWSRERAAWEGKR